MVNESIMKIEKGDLISNGFEDGIVVDIREDGGDVWYGARGFPSWPVAETWEWHRREIKKVNGKELEA
jgi:hypothetical protein